MTTLLVSSTAAFGLTALACCFAWAIWLHAPAWWGGQFSPTFGARRGVERDARHLAWFRWLKTATVVLFFISLGSFIARVWVSDYP